VPSVPEFMKQIQDQDGNTVLEAERATLVGVVLDSTGAAPLAGALVDRFGRKIHPDPPVAVLYHN